MGEWRKDQSKKARRYIWGETRGQNDEVWQDFAQRVKAVPPLAGMRFEKLGREIHFWRELTDDAGKRYWASCLRFVDDGWGYWSVFYRPDERRWRTTPVKELPLGRACAATAEWLRDRFIDR